jgi:Flp pilus assembly protein TadB
MLSDHEKRQLHELEQRLRSDDPRLERRLRGHGGRRSVRPLIRWDVLVGVLTLCAALGALFHQPMLVVIGVLGATAVLFDHVRDHRNPH